MVLNVLYMLAVIIFIFNILYLFTWMAQKSVILTLFIIPEMIISSLSREIYKVRANIP